MVEKDFFIEHATQEVMHQVMSLVRPYPDLDVLQGEYLSIPYSITCLVWWPNVVQPIKLIKHSYVTVCCSNKNPTYWRCWRLTYSGLDYYMLCCEEMQRLTHRRDTISFGLTPFCLTVSLIEVLCCNARRSFSGRLFCVHRDMFVDIESD